MGRGKFFASLPNRHPYISGISHETLRFASFVKILEPVFSRLAQLVLDSKMPVILLTFGHVGIQNQFNQSRENWF